MSSVAAATGSQWAIRATTPSEGTKHGLDAAQQTAAFSEWILLVRRDEVLNAARVAGQAVANLPPVGGGRVLFVIRVFLCVLRDQSPHLEHDRGGLLLIERARCGSREFDPECVELLLGDGTDGRLS